jgi:hypothetical protein
MFVTLDCGHALAALDLQPVYLVLPVVGCVLGFSRESLGVLGLTTTLVDFHLQPLDFGPRGAFDALHVLPSLHVVPLHAFTRLSPERLHLSLKDLEDEPMLETMLLSSDQG